MSIFGGMIWGKLTELPHPELNRDSCINTHRRHGCTACADVCPHQVIDSDHKVASWSACTDCQRCVAVCPTRAISPSQRFMEQLVQLRSGEEERLWLGCERSRRENDRSWDCLCSLPWEALAWLSFHRVLILDLAPCGDCNQIQCRDALGEQLKELHRFLGPQRFQSRVVLAHRDDTQPRPSSAISRRELFQQGAELTKNGAESLLRQMPLLRTGELNLDGVSLRSLLHKEMKRSNDCFTWQVPAITGSCNGCGDCVKRCPTRALRLGEQALVLDIARCTGCRGCAGACPKGCITGIHSVEIGDLSPVKLVGIERLLCARCGKVMRKSTHNGLCPECQRIRMQEALRQRNKEEETT